MKLKLNTEDILQIDRKIRKKYLNTNNLNKDMLQEVVDFETDRLFAYNICRFARYHSYFTSMPVYLYKFTVETERNYTKKFYKMDTLTGVCHADDLPYLFNVTSLDIPLTEDSKSVIKQIVQLWFNFASTG